MKQTIPWCDLINSHWYNKLQHKYLLDHYCLLVYCSEDCICFNATLCNLSVRKERLFFLTMCFSIHQLLRKFVTACFIIHLFSDSKCSVIFLSQVNGKTKEATNANHFSGNMIKEIVLSNCVSI